MLGRFNKVADYMRRYQETNEANPDFQEILKLHEMLQTKNIPHSFEPELDGWHIIYSNGEDFTCSVIENFGSYGMEYDRLEIMGLLTPDEKETDSILGWLTAEDVFARIEAHWNANKEENNEITC